MVLVAPPRNRHYPRRKAGLRRLTPARMLLARSERAKTCPRPAPDMRAVNWKRAQLRAWNHEHSDVNPERIERAIAEDVEWLAAHPSRKSIAAACQAKKGK